MLLTIVLMLCAAPGFVLAAVTIDEHHLDLNLSQQLLLLEDQDDELDLAGAMAASAEGLFQPVGDDHLQLGYGNSAYWIHFRVHNNLIEHSVEGAPDRFYLTVDYPLLDNVEFYHVHNDHTYSMVTGDIYLFNQRYFSLNSFTFPFALQPGESGDIYIRIFSSSSLFFPIKLQSEQAFIDDQFQINSFDGVYIGITIGLGIYNLFLWIGIRNRVYGYYVLMVFSIMLFNTSITGLTFRFWPDSLFFQQICVYFFSFTSGILVILFGMAYLQTNASLPRFHRLLQLLAVMCAVCIPLLFYIPITTSAKLTAALTIFVAIILIIAAIWRLAQGYRPAMYYCLGQGAVIVSVMFTALTSQKIIPLYHIAPEVMKWCSAFELILFSIGLADMVNNERRMREQAQQEAAKAQEQLLGSQIRLNQDLDKLVTLRTQELEIANQQLRDLNVRDDLTGLRNRRYLNEALPNEYKRAFRDKMPLSVLILDIDFFKQLNDTYGHQFGDHCLTEAGRILTECTRRPPDIAVRFGGEEFVIILPSTDLEGAQLVAEKIRTAFENNKIEHGGETALITVSIGVASETPSSRDEHESLLRMADDLLYQAKAKGRNRVECVGGKSSSLSAN